MTSTPTHAQLRREVGVFGATMLGLGSILGTGVFVSIAIAAGVTGPSVILAIALAAGVALCNAMSSAQLAAAHPVSGGTYSYGYRYLSPMFGFTAGWLFLCAKTASAATAALGFAGYLLHTVGVKEPMWVVPIALASVVVLTVIVLMGLRRSNAVNVVIVSITILALLAFVTFGYRDAVRGAQAGMRPLFPDDSDSPVAAFLYATALMFVAYTGYGRVATLGEEVRDPARSIPKAILLTVGVSMVIYVAVAYVGIGSVGARAMAHTLDGAAAPLEMIAQEFAPPTVVKLIAIGAMTAMLGVLLNLLLGLSRVLLAMSRERDMPAMFARINDRRSTPATAVAAVAVVIAGLTLLGDVKLTWAFSAFTVLLYYGITNLAALRLPQEFRLYPRWIAVCGLIACIALAVWVPWEIWLSGLAVVCVGIVWHVVAVRLRAGRAA